MASDATPGSGLQSQGMEVTYKDFKSSYLWRPQPRTQKWHFPSMMFLFGLEVNVSCPVMVIFLEIVMLQSCSLIGSYVRGGERQSPTICKEVRACHSRSIDSCPQINYTADGRSLVFLASFNVSSKCWIPSRGPATTLINHLGFSEIGFKLGSQTCCSSSLLGKNMFIACLK